MSRFVILRGDPKVGTNVEIPFEELGLWVIGQDSALGPTSAMACVCLLCSAMVFGRERTDQHADFHYALAFGMPYGSGKARPWRP